MGEITHRNSRYWRDPKVLGTVPVKTLPSRRSDLSAAKLDKESGTDPVK